MEKRIGKFIVFEGIDGSGKSTQIKYLADKLREKGYQVYQTFEPTDSPIGSLIHEIMISRIKADDKTIAALFVADRVDHLLNEINGLIKKVEEGVIVISDRYYFSSYAYHGVHMDMNWVIEANSLSADLLRPDINIFLDISPEISFNRLQKHRSNLEIYETIENMTKVRQKYLEAFEIFKSKEVVEIVDGNNSEDFIACEVLKVVEENLKL